MDGVSLAHNRYSFQVGHFGGHFKGKTDSIRENKIDVDAGCRLKEDKVIIKGFDLCEVL